MCLSHSLSLFQLYPVSTRASAHATPSVHDFLPLTHPLSFLRCFIEDFLVPHLAYSEPQFFICFLLWVWGVMSQEPGWFMLKITLLDHTHFHNKIYVSWREGPWESDLFSYPQGWALWGIHRNFWINLYWLRKEDPSPTLLTLADTRSTLVSSL